MSRARVCGRGGGAAGGDVNFLRRRIGLHRNAVKVAAKIVVGTSKSNKNRTVELLKFVVDALAETAAEEDRYPAPSTMPKVRFHVPPSDRACAAAHRCLVGDQRRGEPKGGPEDAGPLCERGHDLRCVRRFVRLRPAVCCAECGAKCGHARLTPANG